MLKFVRSCSRYSVSNASIANDRFDDFEILIFCKLCWFDSRWLEKWQFQSESCIKVEFANVEDASD